MSPTRPAASAGADPRGGRKPLVARLALADDAHFDLTAMVDLVFMMNIFFLVTWAYANLAELDLPVARHGRAVHADTTVVVAVTGKAGQRAEVHLGEAQAGEVVADPAEVAAKVQELIEKRQRGQENSAGQSGEGLAAQPASHGVDGGLFGRRGQAERGGDRERVAPCGSKWARRRNSTWPTWWT